MDSLAGLQSEMIWIKSLWTCVCAYSVPWTKLYYLKFLWYLPFQSLDYANLMSFLFSWQNSLFCFSVLFFKKYPIFVTHGHLLKLRPLLFFVWFRKIGKRGACISSILYNDESGASFTRDDSFIHSTNRHRVPITDRTGMRPGMSQWTGINNPHPPKFTVTRRRWLSVLLIFPTGMIRFPTLQAADSYHLSHEEASTSPPR